MNRLTSIVVTIQTDAGPQTFDVDIDKDCVLVWGEAGWQVLADYYAGKGEKAKAKEVREKKCPKARPKGGTAGTGTDATAVIALKDPSCDPSQWP